jgi:hypothetical protein
VVAARSERRVRPAGADEVKNRNGIRGGTPYCSRYFQDTGCALANCQFLHIDKKDTPCLFRREGGTCKKGKK